MDSHSSEPTTEYKSVTVDVPADRVAEFHAFFARFLAGRSGRGRRGRYGEAAPRPPSSHGPHVAVAARIASPPRSGQRSSRARRPVSQAEITEV